METIITKVGENKLLHLYEHLCKELENLASQSGVNDLEKYFKPEGILKKQNYMCRLASSLQNSGHMRNSIKFNNSDINRCRIENCLYHFNTKEAIKHYNSGDDILNHLRNSGIETMRTATSEDGEEPKKNWTKYCRGLYEGIVYLENKNGTKTIDSLISKGFYPPESWKKDTEDIQKNIHGLGPALVCDWLKECGCEWLAKPDIHIIEVLKHLTKEDNISEKKGVTYMADWSKLIRDKNIDNICSPYKLDKIIWLLCTGEFYLDRRKYGRDKIIKDIDEIN